jgi:membrane protein DedA with SNARE-associated domain
LVHSILQYLLDLVTRLGDWSYLIIFGAAMLECAAFAGLLVPGESLVLASGFFAHQGILQLDAVMASAGLGAVAGDNIGYFLGARLGREWLLRKGSRFGLRKKRLEQVDSFFERHGARSVFLGRFIGFARALIPFVAGASRMTYRRFVLADGLGAGLWTVTFVVLGYVLGASWGVAEKWISRGGLLVGAVLLLVFLAGWRRRRHRRGAPRRTR